MALVFVFIHHHALHISQLCALGNSCRTILLTVF